jgi:hypothetical protein
MRNRWLFFTAAAGAVIGVLCCGGVYLVAHCDTLDGPVVKDARTALDRTDLCPVLKWVKKEDEAELRSVFQSVLKVRRGGAEARALADRYFFETLVRLHRAGEGAPYTGLKPAGTDLGPAVSGADRALETGQIEPLVRLVSDAVRAGILERFKEVSERRKNAESSVESGRLYVEAYVSFVHYVEGLHNAAISRAGHVAEPEKAADTHKH